MGGAFHGVRWMCFFEFYFKKMEFVKSPLLYALKASQQNETYLHHLQILKFVGFFNLQKKLGSKKYRVPNFENNSGRKNSKIHL